MSRRAKISPLPTTLNSPTIVSSCLIMVMFDFILFFKIEYK